MLYSYKNQYPGPIPFRIILSDGRTRTDPTTFTAEEIADAGYVAVDDKPNIESNQIVFWSFDTATWVIREKTSEELEQEKEIQWFKVREQRDQMLNAIDWRYLRYQSQVRLGIDPVDDIVALDEYAQALRDITTQPDPYNISWPTLNISNTL